MGKEEEYEYFLEPHNNKSGLTKRKTRVRDDQAG